MAILTGMCIPMYGWKRDSAAYMNPGFYIDDPEAEFWEPTVSWDFPPTAERNGRLDERILCAADP